MTLSPQAKAIYQQYLKTNKQLSTLKDQEQVMVFHLVNGDAVMDPSTGEVHFRFDTCPQGSES